MISHIHLGTRDLGRSVAFYESVLGLLGWRLKFREDPQGWAGWQGEAARPLFLVGRPFDGGAPGVGNGQMVALLAPSRTAVDAAYRAALAAGGSDEGAPGLRPQYHAAYYGAYFRDPDGNKIGVVCHAAA